MKWIRQINENLDKSLRSILTEIEVDRVQYGSVLVHTNCKNRSKIEKRKVFSKCSKLMEEESTSQHWRKSSWCHVCFTLLIVPIESILFERSIGYNITLNNSKRLTI